MIIINENGNNNGGIKPVLYFKELDTITGQAIRALADAQTGYTVTGHKECEKPLSIEFGENVYEGVDKIKQFIANWYACEIFSKIIEA